MYRKLLCFFSLVCCIALQAEETLSPSTHRILQFENEYVKVWKTIIMPDQPLKMPRHDCARVVVGLTGGTLTKIEETGEFSATQRFSAQRLCRIIFFVTSVALLIA